MSDIVITREQPPSRTFELTNGLRWLRGFGTEKTLQQAWFCRETGEVEWRDVPHD